MRCRRSPSRTTASRATATSSCNATSSPAACSRVPRGSRRLLGQRGWPSASRFFGHSYAETLGAWQQRFDAALPAVHDLGFNERFISMWRYYLAYCGGFSAGTIDVMQVRLDV